MWVLGYLVIPGQAVRAQSTASGISTLQIQTVQVKTGQHPSRVVHNPCRIHWGRLFRFLGDQVDPAQHQFTIKASFSFIYLLGSQRFGLFPSRYSVILRDRTDFYFSTQSAVQQEEARRTQAEQCSQNTNRRTQATGTNCISRNVKLATAL